MIHHVTPIQVLPLFPVLDDKLSELLRSLSSEDWQQPTLARKWTVKDVAAHLLDGHRLEAHQLSTADLERLVAGGKG